MKNVDYFNKKLSSEHPVVAVIYKNKILTKIPLDMGQPVCTQFSNCFDKKKS